MFQNVLTVHAFCVHRFRYRETMESMLAEQHYLRSPLRPFGDLDQHNNNLSLEEKALLAARSQLFLRAAAAAAATPYMPAALVNSVYPGAAHHHHQQPPPGGGNPVAGGAGGVPPGVLWSQWACLGPSLLAAHQHQQQQLAAALASVAQMPSPSPTLPRPLAQHRYSPYATHAQLGGPQMRVSPPVSSPDTSLRDAPDPDLSPHHSPAS